jgi:hypothetical protein
VEDFSVVIRRCFELKKKKKDLKGTKLSITRKDSAPLKSRKKVTSIFPCENRHLSMSPALVLRLFQMGEIRPS